MILGGNTTLSIIAGNFSGQFSRAAKKIVLAFSRAPSHNLSFVKRFNIRKGALAESVTGAALFQSAISPRSARCRQIHHVPCLTRFMEASMSSSISYRGKFAGVCSNSNHHHRRPVASCHVRQGYFEL